MTVGGKTLTRRATAITIDGTNGEVFAGEVQTVEPHLTGDFAQFMELGR